MQRWLFFGIILLTSCNPANQLSRLQKNHPYLFEAVTIRDTITVFVPEAKIDTITILSTDTITIERDRLQIRYKVINDSIWITGKCKADTIRVPYEVKCPPQSKVPQKTNNTLIIILLTIIGVLILFLIVVK
jgi:hypothetical protein